MKEPGGVCFVGFVADRNAITTGSGQIGWQYRRSRQSNMRRKKWLVILSTANKAVRFEEFSVVSL
jgi:hypothetical protein